MDIGLLKKKLDVENKRAYPTRRGSDSCFGWPIGPIGVYAHLDSPHIRRIARAIDPLKCRGCSVCCFFGQIRVLQIPTIEEKGRPGDIACQYSFQIGLAKQYPYYQDFALIII